MLNEGEFFFGDHLLGKSKPVEFEPGKMKYMSDEEVLYYGLPLVKKSFSLQFMDVKFDIWQLIIMTYPRRYG